MVVVFANNNNQYDFIILTSIKFALAKVGGPVVAYSPMRNFSNVKRIALVGHGSVGEIESVSATTIGDHLANTV